MPTDFQAIRNIIFDLGNVVIDINPMDSAHALAALGNSDTQDLLDRLQAQKAFSRYERGEWTDAQFRDLLRREIANELLTDDALDQAWNVMLLDIPTERVELLLKLKEHYRLFVLSNTNAVHIRQVNEILHQRSGIADLTHIFEKVYYSHLIRYSKPEPQAYLTVLDENNLLPAQTLFIDDKPENVEAARQLGIEAVWLEPPLTLPDIFANAFS